MRDAEREVWHLEQRIAALKEERDAILQQSGATKEQISRILRMRSPKRNICQLLRELHAVTEGEEREKVEQCLLIAKKMDRRLMQEAGKNYGVDWYDADGKFIA